MIFFVATLRNITLNLTFGKCIKSCPNYTHTHTHTCIKVLFCDTLYIAYCFLGEKSKKNKNINKKHTHKKMTHTDTRTHKKKQWHTLKTYQTNWYICLHFSYFLIYGSIYDLHHKTYQTFDFLMHLLWINGMLFFFDAFIFFYFIFLLFFSHISVNICVCVCCVTLYEIPCQIPYFVWQNK